MVDSIHKRRRQARAEHFGFTVEVEPEGDDTENLADLTKAELLERAAEADVDVSSSMKKDEIIEALEGGDA